uniref:Kinesin motor domain-containing protein n=1 Tax=Kalanchoe fedtschenkoi TaxID=63787 RepID=A0A7N0UUT3_KALFE
MTHQPESQTIENGESNCPTESSGCSADLSDVNVSELLTRLDSVATRSLFDVINKILDGSIDKNNGDLPYGVSCLLKKVVRAIERRVAAQAENIQTQNILYKSREEKYQSRLRVLKTLAKGTTEENEVVTNQLQKVKTEKSKIEEQMKIDEQDLAKLLEEKDHNDLEILALKEDLNMTKKTFENLWLELEAHARETKIDMEQKVKELEYLLMGSRDEINDLKAHCAYITQLWKKKEITYKSSLELQSSALQELRMSSKLIKQLVLKTQKSYLEEFNYLGVKLKGVTTAAENYHIVLAENRKLYNEVLDLKGNIRVYCRIRPFLPGQSQKQTTIEYIGENGDLVITNPIKQGKDSRRLFKFNKVFAPTSTQDEVFLDTQPLIRSVLDGYNVCIFAYGQTGSGKTYTMSGPEMSSQADWGVNYRALNDLFCIAENRKSSITYEIGVQMVEIYNEQVRDLLSIDGSQRRLGIWSTTQPNGLAVPEASMHPVRSTPEVLELMTVGSMNRAVGATALNERSSRSHSVLTVHVSGKDAKTGAIMRGNLHLIDLAGSERVERSEAVGDRLKEAQHINKSLSALGDVIFALAQKNSHVPFRNSKLTQILQSSLGGQAKTLMFVQLNPDVESYSETISTLKFAERVSGVELGAARSNKEGRDMKEFMNQLASLKDIITKKDEEIQRLRRDKVNINGEKQGVGSYRYDLASPGRHSIRSPRQNQRTSGGKGTSDLDNCSEYSDKQSESGSQQSIDDFIKVNSLLPSQSNIASRDGTPNISEDVELLGFGEADCDERLSDISDGGLSMGTGTDGSVSSIVEFTMFPEAAKPNENPENVSKGPKATPNQTQSRHRLSVLRKPSGASSSSKKPPAGSSSLSSLRTSKRWQ